MFNEKPPRPLPYKYPSTAAFKEARLKWLINYHLHWKDVEDADDRYTYIAFYLDCEDPETLICPYCQTPLLRGIDVLRTMGDEWADMFTRMYGTAWADEEETLYTDGTQMDIRLSTFVCPWVRVNYKTFVATLRPGDQGVFWHSASDKCSMALGGGVSED